MKKQIVITNLFEFGGSNSHFKTLCQYFGNERVILILESNEQLVYLGSIIEGNLYETKILSNLHGYAHLSYLFNTNIRELLHIISSIFKIFFISFKNGFADVTISTVEPEKHLYLLWLPFIKVNYILHSTPKKKFTWFTSSTCNYTLGKQKKIITVSNANKKSICENWEVIDKKKEFIKVIYNCTLEKEIVESGSRVKDNTNRTIVTLGHVIGYKNPKNWLEVARVVTSVRNDVTFLWLGSGPLWDEYKNNTRKINNIVFQGMVPDPSTYLKDAAIYFQPSLEETQGISVLEAMYNGLPCVVANVGGLPESIQMDYNGILADPHNIEENIKAIIHLLDNDELLNTYGENSKKRYMELFSYAKFKKNMDAVYR